MFCVQCGNQLKPNTSFCTNCGKRVVYPQPDYRNLNPEEIIEKYITTDHVDHPDIYRFSHYKLAEFRCIQSNLKKAKVIADFSVERKKRVNSKFGYYSTTKINKTSDFSKLGNYIVVDTETTGLRPDSDKIIDISAVKFVNFRPVEVFSTFIDPKKHIPNAVTELTGIDNEIIIGSPTFPQIQDSLSEFIKNSTLVFHNARFDLSFLYYAGMAIDTDAQCVIDTLELAKKYLREDEGKKYSSYSLEILCSHRNIWIADAHSSIADALATGLLFNEIIKEISGEVDLSKLY